MCGSIICHNCSLFLSFSSASKLIQKIIFLEKLTNPAFAFSEENLSRTSTKNGVNNHAARRFSMPFVNGSSLNTVKNKTERIISSFVFKNPQKSQKVGHFYHFKFGSLGSRRFVESLCQMQNFIECARRIVGQFIDTFRIQWSIWKTLPIIDSSNQLVSFIPTNGYLFKVIFGSYNLKLWFQTNIIILATVNLCIHSMQRANWENDLYVSIEKLAT